MKVYQYNLNGEFIQEWKNGHRASVALGIQHTTIYEAIHGKLISAGGYYWSKKKVDIYIPRKNRNVIPVIQLDNNGNFIKEWECATQASLALSGFRRNQKGILLVCRDERTTALKYKWKFKNEEDMWR